MSHDSENHLKRLLSVKNFDQFIDTWQICFVSKKGQHKNKNNKNYIFGNPF